MKAIVRSRQLLANSEALLSYPESCEPDALTLAPEKIECPATALQVIVSKRDFEDEVVSMDAKHFRDCVSGNARCSTAELPSRSNPAAFTSANSGFPAQQAVPFSSSIASVSCRSRRTIRPTIPWLRERIF